jgi:hypothetical protein
MRTRIRPAVTVLFAAVLTLLLLGLIPSAGAGAGKNNVCHRTGSKSNPYVGIQPSKNAKGHTTHPDKNGNSDKFNEPGWQKGPHQSGGCTSSDNPPACPPGSTLPECNPPPPPHCVPPDPLCTDNPPGIPPPGGLAGPAEAIAGQPTVTG